MTSILTAIVVTVFFCALTYMAVDLVDKNKQIRKPPNPRKPKERVNTPRHLIPHELKQLTHDIPAEKPVATKEEILQFWTEVMKDPKNSIDTRLKASELLGLYYSE